MRLASADDSFAPCYTDNYEKLLAQLPKRTSINIPFLENIDSIIASEYDVSKCIASFPNGSGAGADGWAP